MSDQLIEQTPATVDHITRPEISIHYSRVVLPIVIVTWVSALMLGPIGVIRTWNEDIALGGLMTFMFLAALQGVFGTRWLMAPSQRLLNRSTFRTAEIALIFVLARLLSWATLAPPTPEVWRGYLLEPLSILDGAFLLFLLLTLGAWNIAGAVTRIFYGMAILPEEETFFTEDTVFSKNRKSDAFGIINLRSNQLNSFLSYWLNGALFLIVCATAATLQFESFGADIFRNVTRLGLPPELLVGLILFMVLGLWLLSWGRLQVMQLRWLTEKSQIHRPVPTQWQRFSLILIGGVALVAGFLPIGSTFALARIIQAFIFVIIQIVGFIIGIFLLLIGLIFSLFSNGEAPPLERPEPAEFELAPFAGTEAAGAVSETVQLVRGGIFWGIAVIAIIALLIFFLRERGFKIDGRILRAVWRDIGRVWHGFWLALFGRVELATRAVRQRFANSEAIDGQNQPPWRYVNLRNLPPRERIRYFYLSIVRRAEARGVARRASETPLEFVEDLKEEWPDAEGEINELTDAFLEARYSSSDFTEEDIGPIKRTWRQVRSGIKRRR